MSIRQRITLLVILTFITILCIGGFSIDQSYKNAIQVRLVTGQSVPSTLASADLVSRLKDVQLAAMTFTTSPDDSITAQAKTDLENARIALKKALDLQVREATGATQKNLTKEASDALTDYMGAIDDTVKAKMQGRNDIAQANFFANVVQYEMVLQQIVDTLRVEKSRINDSAIAVLNQNLYVTIHAVAWATALSILVLGVFSMLLYRQIAKPIGRMQSMMSDIAERQDFTRRVPVDRRDEVGRSIEAFNAMLAKIEESSSLLRAKTQDMQTMLQHMPQGILTVAEHMKVHHEFSAYLETILETKEIAGRSVMDLLFADTRLGADTLSQIETIVETCIGEDAINFELNSHLLVSEIEKKMPDDRIKILDLNWSPIVDDNDSIVRLMVCVRDVTEIKKLAAEASEQRRELEIIGEILAVTQEKFHEFILNALRLVDDNEMIIREHAEADSDAINNLFRNMHTVKGNARTYGLLHLTNVIHESEQMYDELRKAYPGLVWDQGMLLESLFKVRDLVERYSRINEVSLGRKGPGRRGNVEHYLMVHKLQITETLQKLDAVNTSSLHDLVAARDAVRRTLRLLGTETLSEILSGVIYSLPSLAAELGKAAPLVRIEDNGYVLRTQMSGLLKNVFMHLMRNALDHGLETPEERLKLGKPAAGEMQLETTVQQNVLRLVFKDDGRGLALAKIRDKAISKGWIEPNEPATDEDIADLIFKAGFSTADRLTEVSGRGVGMDAVREFLKREQGSIELVFLDQAAGAEYRKFALHIVLPGQFAVAREEGALLSSNMRAQGIEAQEVDLAKS
ncbi:MAG: HAMP domain-containing protein [Pseudomonadales bacterium]|nr:HAMP domain-containing protein [Pseudomonadales bacterium]